MPKWGEEGGRGVTGINAEKGAGMAHQLDEVEGNGIVENTILKKI